MDKIKAIATGLQIIDKHAGPGNRNPNIRSQLDTLFVEVEKLDGLEHEQLIQLDWTYIRNETTVGYYFQLD